VEGWIYCDKLSLVGTRVLAFVDDECVGAGVIEIFRQDLVEASIGDGVAGFSFPIVLDPSQNPRVLDVRLEGGNALIRQRASRLAPRTDGHRAPRDASSLSWMRARGWLRDEDHHLLRVLGEFGIHRQPISVAACGRTDEACCEDIARITGEQFELLMLRSVSVSPRIGISVPDLAAQCQQLQKTFLDVPPVIALWSRLTSCLQVVEGSHLDENPAAPGGGVDYEFGDEYVLWLNLDSQYSAPTGGITSPLIAFIPGVPAAAD
jgi:hypothetical protein